MLKSFLPDSSWGQVQSWIRSRHIQINGNLCLDPARRLTEKDVIKFWKEPLPKPVTAEQLKLPYLDEHLLVVEKPAGITSVWHREERKLPAKRRQLQPTLEELLSGALAKILGLPGSQRSSSGRPASHLSGSLRKPKPNRGQRHPNSPSNRWPVYPVHRLDRDTSGLMLFARSRIAEQKLVAMFRDHLIHRQYWAVVHGAAVSQTIRTMLVRDRGDRLRGSLPERPPADRVSRTSDNEETGQLAITHVEHVESFGQYSIVRCRLETGRTHQIRIHLSEHGHPLCGEKTYVRLPDGSILADHSLAPRQALHAERLAFTHPLTGERLEFHMPLPTDLKHWLNRVRSKE
ncbi:MAG: RluA family pseudouridine synthase [Pirellulaceae bacterium]|nr:RluA family pseudouridine synthase [Pirellulaceae bacterium]